MLFDPVSLKRLRLDAGNHRLDVIWADSAHTDHAIEVLPGGAATLALDPGLDPAVVSSIDKQSGPSPWPWVVTGVGVAVAGVGAVLVGVAGPERSVSQGANVAGRPLVTGTTQSEHGSSWSSADRLAGTGIALLAVGAAATAGGISWWIVSEPTGAGVRVGGRF